MTFMFLFNLVLILLMILFPSVIASAFTSDEKLIETVVQVMPGLFGGDDYFRVAACVPEYVCRIGAGQGFYLYCITS